MSAFAFRSYPFSPTNPEVNQPQVTPTITTVEFARSGQ
jgi:hypothetical protein